MVRRFTKGWLGKRFPEETSTSPQVAWAESGQIIQEGRKEAYSGGGAWRSNRVITFQIAGGRKTGPGLWWVMNIYEGVREILGLGLEPKDLSFVQVSLRGVIVFIAALAMLRVGNKRFLAKMSAFDAILGFILASMLARAVNGSSAFFPTLGGGFVLVGVHRLIARLAIRWAGFGKLVKGGAEAIVRDGKLDRKTMGRVEISEDDLLEEARLNGPVMSVADIQLATLERNGQVSIIPKE